MKDEYVVGFCFTEDQHLVNLLRKNRPAWQCGLLNGVGGKIEKGEEPLAAMVREFYEEVDVYTDHDDWDHFCTLQGREFTVYCFCCFDTVIFSNMRNKTSEHIETISTQKFDPTEMVSNVPWMIHMCLDKDLHRMLVTAKYV